jgi:DNA-binding transcriptional LysR family regulator
MKLLKLPIELRHLRYVLVAAQHRSLRKAAETLNLKQSTLSRRIRELEDELRVVLFERSIGGSVPSAAGRELLGYARQIIQDIETAMSRLKRHGQGQRGQLAMGFYTCLSAGNLRATIADYSRRFPEIDFVTTASSRADLLSALNAGTLDIVIMTGCCCDWKDRSLQLWSERIVAALPTTHPLASQLVVQWTELREEVFLFSLQDPGPELQSLLMSKLPKMEDVPRVILHNVGINHIKSLVSTGLGISLMWECCTRTQIAGLVYREVYDGTGPSHSSFTAYWRETNSNPALQSFLTLLRERYPDLSPPVVDREEKN